MTEPAPRARATTRAARRCAPPKSRSGTYFSPLTGAGNVARGSGWSAGIRITSPGSSGSRWPSEPSPGNLGSWLESADADKDPPATVAAPRLADLMKRAEANDATAEHELAQMHGTGIGVPMSPKEEYNWLRRSARHGNVEAQYELGVALREGRGTIQDFDEARKWLQRAAEGGNGKAQYALGHMYRTGTGTPVRQRQGLCLAQRRRGPGRVRRGVGARYRHWTVSRRPSCWRLRPKLAA